MLGGTIAAIYYWVITYWITAIVLAMYFAFYKKDGIKRNSFAYWVFFIFSPSFGYGLMMRNYDFYPKKNRIQSAAYYVFKYMGLVHFIHIAIWVLSTVFLIVIGRGEIVEGLFFVSILTFTLLLFYALLPGVIARLFFYTDFGPLSLEKYRVTG